MQGTVIRAIRCICRFFYGNDLVRPASKHNSERSCRHLDGASVCAIEDLVRRCPRRCYVLETPVPNPRKRLAAPCNIYLLRRVLGRQVFYGDVVLAAARRERARREIEGRGSNSAGRGDVRVVEQRELLQGGALRVVDAISCDIYTLVFCGVVDV